MSKVMVLNTKCLTFMESVILCP